MRAAGRRAVRPGRVAGAVNGPELRLALGVGNFFPHAGLEHEVTHEGVVVERADFEALHGGVVVRHGGGGVGGA